jgi:predicted lipid-binding transport protein (Tim44 family)
MGDEGSLINILIFAGIAIFLFFKLRSVLGRRTGEEREHPNPLEGGSVAPFRAGGIDPSGAGGTRPAVIIDNDPNLPQSLDAKLARIHSTDPNFDEKHFLAGARAAFEMIVTAFAAGDLATLRPLLSSQLYGEFGRVISERPNRDPLDAVRFAGPVEVEVTDARLIGREAQIQVRFASKQLHGEETEPPEHETIDNWTFARDMASRDPNWQLIETVAGH